MLSVLIVFGCNDFFVFVFLIFVEVVFIICIDFVGEDFVGCDIIVIGLKFFDLVDCC